METVIALCLVCMIAIVVTTVVRLCVANRAKRLKYLKNFKKGKFALIYIAAIPLYWMAIYHNGTPIGGAFLLAIRSCVDLIVLKFDYNSVASLMADNLFFRVTMDICFALVAVNAAIFALTLFGRGLSNSIRLTKARYFSHKVYVVVGFNEQSKQIIKSIDGSVVLLTNEDAADYAFIEKIACVRLQNNAAATIVKLFKRFDNKSIEVIINTGSDAHNLIIVEQLSEVIKNLDLIKLALDSARGLNGYVFGEPENMSSFLRFVEETDGCIHYVNKYKLIAMDFVEKYPLTQFMTEKQIDYETATIKKDIDINVVMIGFGKTNQQIFLTSVANNQFMTMDETLKEKAVNYYIYDKKDSKNDKNLNHSYYRYSNELAKPSEYLPLPPKPANEKFFELDINDNNFYDSVKRNLATAQPYNYIIVAFGNDMENLDFGEKIVAKLKEWELFDKTKVFVKIRNSELCEHVIKKLNCGFIAFGNERRIVYNVNRIVGEMIELMAKDRHCIYKIKAGMTKEEEAAAQLAAIKTWYEQEQVRRESNIYACLSIRMKLHLLGLDYVAKDNLIPSAENEFMLRYEKGDPIKYSNKPRVNGRLLIEHTNDFVTNSVRHNLAVQEHQRWNAYMITCGVIPSTVKQIEAGDSKRLDLRRHGNITTFEGLEKFRAIEAKRRGCSEEETDVIRYDYEIMDDLVWLLNRNDYKIVNRTDLNISANAS